MAFNDCNLSVGGSPNSLKNYTNSLGKSDGHPTYTDELACLRVKLAQLEKDCTALNVEKHVLLVRKEEFEKLAVHLVEMLLYTKGFVSGFIDTTLDTTQWNHAKAMREKMDQLIDRALDLVTASRSPSNLPNSEGGVRSQPIQSDLGPAILKEEGQPYDPDPNEYYR